MTRGGGVGGGGAQRARGARAVRARLRGEKLPIWASPRSENRVLFCRRLAGNPPTYFLWPSPRFFESPLAGCAKTGVLLRKLPVFALKSVPK